MNCCICIGIFSAALAVISCSRQENPAQTASAPPPQSASMASMPSAPGIPASLTDWARGAQIFEGMGAFHRKISSSSAEAQAYFDQGMRFMWAFNHDEASRSFARAALSDPRCGICLWGVALTVGPNYNMPLMAEPRARVAFDSLQRANSLLEHASPEERALINALRARYPQPTALDPSNEGPVLTAYATAMRDVARQFPNDNDIQTMYAESLMNTNAWKLWTTDGKAAAGTDQIVKTLETVLARDPSHPGANHYYIHATEASPHPEKAVAAAERLRGMMPAAGHLEHMPSHTMQRVGRYADAAEANRKGAAADRIYLGKTQPPDYYAMYVAHNYEFLGYATAMQGRKVETLSAMTQLKAVFPEDAMLAMPGTDWYVSERYLALVRFGLWDEMLTEAAPNPTLKALTGGYLYGKVAALAAKGRIAEAKQAQIDLESTRASLPPDATAGLNRAADVLALAATLASAQLQMAEHKDREAIVTLTAAVAQEDKLSYDEPADWFIPVRHMLGAELIKTGQFAQAESVYRQDLNRNPSNGWSLFGLALALRQQGKSSESAAVEGQFAAAWKQADVALTASTF